MNGNLVDADAVVAVLRQQTAESQKAWAFANGFSPPFVNFVLRGKKPPSARLAKALGFRKVGRVARQYEPLS